MVRDYIGLFHALVGLLVHLAGFHDEFRRESAAHGRSDAGYAYC